MAWCSGHWGEVVVVLAALTLQAIDPIWGARHAVCTFTVSASHHGVTAIYWPPVTKTSDLKDDTELTVQVLVMAQYALQPLKNSFILP